jgi:hypothetical protein
MSDNFLSGFAIGAVAIVIIWVCSAIKASIPKPTNMGWFDGSGDWIEVVRIGHSGVTVRHRGYNSHWTFRRCAEDAGWPLSKMLDYLGLPDEKTLKEAGMTMGEWLSQKNQDS